MRLLIVGSLKGYVSSAAKIAIARGARVNHAETIDQAMQELRQGKGADLVLIDLHLDIEFFVKSVRSEHIAVPVVACGVSDSPEKAAKVIEYGADDYLPLPPNPELIAGSLEIFATDEKPFIWDDPKTSSTLRIADKVAPSEATVLITGESGTGKEVMARYIHKKSKRSKKSFISLNCAAIPDNLLESELFGHEKGAFTGAIAQRIGKFEEANGGTLFLDEISEMPLRLQAKLLRAIQEREIDRIGGAAPIKVNIRIIATSNRDLRESIKNGDFREDLYFRLNVVNIELLPLRERTKDIPVLIQYFIKKYAQLNGIGVKKISKIAEIKLEKYPWKGNVRELENCIHRGLILSQDDEIQDTDLFLENSRSDVDSNDHQLVGKTMAEVEKNLIIQTIQHCQGNRTHAASILGISIRTLRNKLNEYKVNDNNIGV